MSQKPDIDKDREAFIAWWYNEGSGMGPLPLEDAAEHVKRVCEIAWLNGADKAQETTEDNP